MADAAPFPTHEQRFRLDGRTIFLSGAAGHLGRAMALALGQAGGHVILNGRTQSKLDALAADMKAMGLSASTAAFDVMDRATSAAFLQSLDRLDVLINNAITGLVNKPDAPDPFVTMLESGLVVAHANIQAAMRGLEAAAAAVGHASIINITSVWAHVSPTFPLYEGTGLLTAPQYAATKGGLLQLTRYLACQLAPKRIRVNSLSPGIFPWDNIVAEHGEFVGRIAGRTPLGRNGEAHEIGGPAVFLASDASTFMTGADLRVDGGWAAW